MRGSVIDLWAKGKGCTRLMQLIDILLPHFVMVARDKQEHEMGFAWKDYRSHYAIRRQILHDMLSIIFGDTLHTNKIPQKEFEQNLHGPFNDMMNKHWNNIKQQFGHRGEKDSYLVLRHLLRSIGLKADYVTVGKKRETKVFYLDEDSLEMMLKYAQDWCDTHDVKLDIPDRFFAPSHAQI